MASLDIKEYEQSWAAEGNRQKWAWATKLYTQWIIHCNNLTRHHFNEPPIIKDLPAMDDDELDYSLSRFISEIRRKDCTEYPGKTLLEIITSIQAYLRHNGR